MSLQGLACSDVATTMIYTHVFKWAGVRCVARSMSLLKRAETPWGQGGERRLERKAGSQGESLNVCNQPIPLKNSFGDSG